MKEVNNRKQKKQGEQKPDFRNNKIVMVKTAKGWYPGLTVPKSSSNVPPKITQFVERNSSSVIVSLFGKLPSFAVALNSELKPCLKNTKTDLAKLKKKSKIATSEALQTYEDAKAYAASH